jgi:hypothetical protein
MTSKQYGVAENRIAAASLFLNAALADGPVAVAELEVKARAAGLLGERQKITNSKQFKATKKNLGVRSKRTGFGRSGEWFWALPTPPKTNLVETAADIAPQAADHARPNPHAHAEPRTCCGSGGVGETTPSFRVPPDWERGVERLHQQPPPAGVPPHRWHLFLADCARFLHPRDRLAERAAELGWDAEALFGCDRHRPLDHPGAGLLWHLAGGRLATIHTDWAAIEVNGKQRVFHRRPSAPNITLPWRFR